VRATDGTGAPQIATDRGIVPQGATGNWLGWAGGRVRAGPAPIPTGAESLFQCFPGAYALFREHLFRNHTEAIVGALWPGGQPPDGALLLEVGCGPGFYARRLAERFPRLRVVGLDRAAAQLVHARARAARRGLGNCRFELGDARALPPGDGTVDAVLASRLFTVVPERERALAEMHRVLRPGGRCVVVEPRSRVRAALPLLALWLLARAAGARAGGPRSYREPVLPVVLSDGQFRALLGSRPWGRLAVWHDARYRFASGEKPPVTP
jgi:arsenite methyltransferase